MFVSSLTPVFCFHILHQVTTVALSATVAHLAVGLGDGTVILYRHLDQSLALSTSLTSLPKHEPCMSCSLNLSQASDLENLQTTCPVTYMW